MSLTRQLKKNIKVNRLHGGRLKKSKRQEELDKIPFEIEDTKEPSKEIKFRIGSVKSKLNI